MPPSLPCPVCAIDLSSLCPSSACIDHLSLCLRSREVPANNINIPEIVITPPDAPHDLLCNTVTVVDAKLLHAPKRNKFGRAVGVVGRRRKVVSEEEKQGIVGRRLRIETVAKSYERRAWRVHAPRGGNRMHLRRIAARLMRGRGGDEVRRAEAANGSVLAEGMETQAAPSKSEVTDMSPVYNSLEWKDGGSAATNSTPLLEDAQNREEPTSHSPGTTRTPFSLAAAEPLDSQPHLVTASPHATTPSPTPSSTSPHSLWSPASTLSDSPSECSSASASSVTGSFTYPLSRPRRDSST
ncbi:hypothetical protein BU26DRAFT_505345 [Trematosphaeria pertusa]|uniref:Uncharacterized protein n=1 Tax=Trematosphaeria pertusa TaxID=390896 RepID=A0A6A6IFD2_9PLEO|nr:uncharacterized protein BU26DRAFT_505345 [Trematosphaeria pertusa]KAF2249295.1 hypothetical protein BU26DRAFT_505345 [Trematosphaeria pertusa]